MLGVQILGLGDVAVERFEPVASAAAAIGEPPRFALGMAVPRS